MGHRVRDRAVEALWRADREGRFLEDTLASAPARGLDIRERALLTELANGPLRRRGTLDHVLARYRPVARIRPQMRWILRVAIYQLGFLDRAADRVAVDAAVRQAKAAFGIGGARLANAILRRVQAEWMPIPLARDEDEDPGRDVSVGPGRVWRGPAGAFPDPAASPADNLALRHAYPPWLAARWLTALGPERARAVAVAQNTRPGLHCWADPVRGGGEGAARVLAEEGVRTSLTPYGLRVEEGAARVTASRPFREGWLLIQDETAASVTPLLDVQPGDRVLEVGAAPGTKTVQLARAVGEHGRVVAVDRSPRRLKRVRENLLRFGLESRVDLVAAAGERLPATVCGGFDRLLVDAPCSNTGVLARRPEARWRMTPEDVVALASIQRALLQAGLEALRSGGRAVYATCSIEPEENAGVTGAAGAEVETEALTLPDGVRDGGYKARLTKG